MAKAILLILKRDFMLAFVRKGYFFNNLAFFVVATLLLDFILLKNTRVSAGINILNVLLLPYVFASLLSAREIFQEDFNDSTLVQLLISGCSSFYIAIAKVLGYWLQLLSVLVVTVPVLCFIYNINLSNKIFLIFLVFLLLSITVSSLVVFASGLTFKLNNSVVITCLIVMPLLASLLLYSSSTLAMIIGGSENSILLAYIKILFMITLICSTIAVLACSYILTKI